MWVAFTNAKATHIFSAKVLAIFNDQWYAIFNDQSFNDMLHVTNDIVSFEQLGPNVHPTEPLRPAEINDNSDSCLHISPT